MKLELMIMAGAQTKEFLSELAALTTRLEAATGKLKAGAKADDVDTVADAEETDEEAPKRGRKPKSEALDDDSEEADDADETDEEDDKPADEESEEEESDDEEEDKPAKPAKKAAGANDELVEMKKKALRALNVYAAKHGKPKAKKVLYKFNVESIHDLPLKQYPKLIAALAV